MALELHTEIGINASPAKVWEILTDFSALPDWNPMMISALGEIAVGQIINVQLKTEDGKCMTIKPRLLAVHPNKELRWKGHLLVPGIFDGEHRFVIEPHGQGVRFIHAEVFSGFLARPLMSLIRKTMLSTFQKMNEALKNRAEAEA